MSGGSGSGSGGGGGTANRSATNVQFNKWINGAFRKHGLSLRGDAGQAIKSHFDDRFTTADRDTKQQIESTLDRVVTYIKAKRKSSAGAVGPYIELDAVMHAFEALHNENRPPAPEPDEKSVEVVESFSLPKFRYSHTTKNFFPVALNTLTMHGDASDKADMIRDRFTLLLQRTLRDARFQTPTSTHTGSHAVRRAAELQRIAASESKHRASGGEAAEAATPPPDPIVITALESLMQRSGSKTIFGLLSQPIDGQVFIEDLQTSIAVDLTECHDVTDGLITDHCFVLAQGVFRNDVFYVKTIGFPPHELRETTLAAFPQMQRCGLGLSGLSEQQITAAALRTTDDKVAAAAYATSGGSAAAGSGGASATMDSKEIDTIRMIIRDREQRMDLKARELALAGGIDLSSPAEADRSDFGEYMVVLSDVFLDQPKVLQKLSVLFDGYSKADIPVCMFVFMGNFVSKKLGTSSGDLKRLRSYFDGLCDVITRYSSLAQHSQFLFLSGPGDSNLSVGNVLPRTGLAPYFTQKLRDKLKHVHFATNPCRVLYYSHEICFFREDLLHRVRTPMQVVMSCGWSLMYCCSV